MFHGYERGGKENLRIETVLRVMLLDQIMRQLMRKYNPPVGSSLNSAFACSTRHLVLVDLSEESEVAEDRSVRVERNCTPALIVEDVYCLAG